MPPHEILYFAVPAAAFILFCIFLYVRMRAAWSRVARKHGLRKSTRDGDPILTGELRGRRVKVEVTSLDHVHRTRYQVKYPSLGLGLEILKVRHEHSISGSSCEQEVRVDVAELDGDFRIRGRDPREVRAFLTPDRQLRLRRAHSAFAELLVQDTSVTGIRNQSEDREEVLEASLLQLVRLADALASRTPPVGRLAHALDAAGEGDLATAVDSLAQGDGKTEPDADERVTAAEILFSLGQYERSRKLLEGVAPELHEEDEALALLEETRRLGAAGPGPGPVSPPRTAPEPVRPPLPTPTTSGDPAPATGAPDDHLAAPPEAHREPAGAIEHLFGDSEFGFRITERFEAGLQGRFVRWSGELVRVSSFSSDLVFGPQPGTRALVKIAETGGHEVHAVLGLPPGARQALVARVGETVSFEGWLARCDAFMRNLFVSEARITP